MAAVFFIKNGVFFKSKSPESEIKNSLGLKYDETDLIGILVNKDTDLDGIPDWEEGLWGTDPSNKDTNGDGVSDNEEISKLKAASIASEGADSKSLEPATKTEQFSRELLATVATLSQTGAMDQVTADKLGESISQQIENSVPERIYNVSQIIISKDNSLAGMKKYNKSMGILISDKYPRNEEVFQILSDAIDSNGEIQSDALGKLNTIVRNLNLVVTGMQKIPTPSDLSALHINFLNSFEQIYENLSNLQKANEDPILAMSAISKYSVNIEALDNALDSLNAAIKIN